MRSRDDVRGRWKGGKHTQTQGPTSNAVQPTPGLLLPPQPLAQEPPCQPLPGPSPKPDVGTRGLSCLPLPSPDCTLASPLHCFPSRPRQCSRLWPFTPWNPCYLRAPRASPNSDGTILLLCLQILRLPLPEDENPHFLGVGDPRDPNASLLTDPSYRSEFNPRSL